MTILDAIFLGVVQGLTEFLPVSSTGHLILARDVLGIATDYGLAVDAMLHLATALAVVIYFRRDIGRLVASFFALAQGKEVVLSDKILLAALILGTVPAAIAGFFLESTMDTLFRSATLVAWVLILGSILFLVAEYVAHSIEPKRELSVGRGIVLGLFQTLALVPGMSRSGATIAGGLLLGLSREEAARFGFLLSFPIIFGAGAKKLLELESTGVLSHEWMPILVGGTTAFLSGLAAIHYLLRYLKNHTLLVFVLYRVGLALLVFVLL